jgi:tight adherence protein B
MMALILAAVFLGTVLLIFAAYVLVNRRRLMAAEVLRERLSPFAPAGPTGGATILKDVRASQLAPLERMLAGKTFTESLRRELERAGSKMSVGEFVLLTVVLAMVGLMIGQRIGLLAAPLCAALVGALPLVHLRRKQRARLKKFEEQLPEAVDMLVNAMKSGYSLQAAMKFVGEEMGTPLGPEFTRLYDEQRLGMEVRNALLNLQDRIDTLDCKMFVTALLIQRETGGNLAEVLTNLATLMRERVAIRGKIDSLTAEPRMSAVVLGLLPVVLFAIVFTLNRNYLHPLWTTQTGRVLSIYGIISVVMGYAVLRKIGQIDI